MENIIESLRGVLFLPEDQQIGAMGEITARVPHLEENERICAIIFIATHVSLLSKGQQIGAMGEITTQVQHLPESQQIDAIYRIESQLRHLPGEQRIGARNAILEAANSIGIGKQTELMLNRSRDTLSKGSSR